MRAPAVRPELGPSLPTLLAPLPRAARLGLGALVALLVLAVVAAQFEAKAEVTRTVVREGPAPFNLAVPAGFERVPGEAGLVLQTAEPRQRVIAQGVRLPAYEGDPLAALMVLAGRRAQELQALPGFVLRGEGRTRVNEQPGYQLLFQHRGEDGRVVYGRRVLLVPPEEDAIKPTAGAELDLRTARTPAVQNLAAVGNNGPLKTVLRSFRFGTDAP